MQKIILMVCSALVFSTRLDFNSQECQYYLNKFDQKRYHFGGETVIINSTMVQVNLKYWDEIYFDDPQYFGLVQEDGKTPESTCLDMKIFKFSTKNYTDKEQVFDIKIIPSEYSQQKIRYYSFQFTLQELQSRMIKQENSDYYLYKGYYAIEFHAAGTDDLQFYYYFQFTIFVDKFYDSIYTKNLGIVQAAFKSLSQYEAIFLEDELIFYWCKDFSCDQVTQEPPQLYSRAYYVLLLQQGGYYFEGLCYLNDTEVWFTSDDGLYRKAHSKEIVNVEIGQVKIVLPLQVAWNNFKITVISNCINENKELQIYEQVSGSSGLIQSIIYQGSCEDQCVTNGIAQLPCDINCKQFGTISCDFGLSAGNDDEQDSTQNQTQDSTEILLVILFTLLYVGFVLKCLPKQLDLQREISMIYLQFYEN